MNAIFLRFFLSASLCFGWVLQAQDSLMTQPRLVSKKGEPYLPEAGDFSLGIDATPALRYVGNFFNGNTDNTAPSPLFPNQYLALQGRYFVDANTAYRGVVRIGVNQSSNRSEVPDLTDEDGEETVTDIVRTRSSLIVIGGGLEKRRGNTRIQGIYGGEALIGFGNGTSGRDYQIGNTTYQYGNDIEDELPFGGSRVTRETVGGRFLFVLRGLAGVEIFLFPKMSLGIEFGLGLAIERQGAGETTTEVYDSVEDEIETITETNQEASATTTIGFDTDNNNGALTLNFFF
jgi:hypothetical protein